MDTTRWPHAPNARTLVRQKPDDLHEKPGRRRVKIIAGFLMAAAVAFGSGCAKTDWIDRTLVTVDVTGTWYGRLEGGAAAGVPGEYRLELKQEGATVTGFLSEIGVNSTTGKVTGPINGSVAGDLFSFSSTRDMVRAVLTVNGDEMTGTWSGSATRAISLRRVEPSSSR